MSGWNILIIAILVIGGGLGAFAAFRSPTFILGLVKAIMSEILPILAKRGTPEQEKAANENYRRGGDGNIPLPAQREKHGNLIDLLRGKRDGKGGTAKGPVSDRET